MLSDPSFTARQSIAYSSPLHSLALLRSLPFTFSCLLMLLSFVLLFGGLAVSLALLFIVFCCVFHGQLKEKFIGQHFIFRCPAKAAAAAPTRCRLWSETSTSLYGDLFWVSVSVMRFVRRPHGNLTLQRAGKRPVQRCQILDAVVDVRCPIPNMNFPKRGQQAHKYQSRAGQGTRTCHKRNNTVYFSLYEL